MRHNSRRMKNRSGSNGSNGNNGQRRGNVPPRMQVFDSNGPDVRIRGTAWQVHEKYLALAKDSNSSGDLIMAENYMQHAEHYQRIINSFNEQMGNWSPMNAENDDASEGDVQVQHGQQYQQQQIPPQQQAVNGAAQRSDAPRNDAPRADRRDDGRGQDLGLPSSLFKPAAPAALETA